jgi:hypothetical protein
MMGVSYIQEKMIFHEVGILTHLLKTCESMCATSENLESATGDNATLVHGRDTILTSGNGAVSAVPK